MQGMGIGPEVGLAQRLAHPHVHATLDPCALYVGGDLRAVQGDPQKKGLSLLIDCSPHRTRTGATGLPPTGPAAEIKRQLDGIRRSIAPRAVAKLGGPAGLKPIKQIQKKAETQGRHVRSAEAIAKCREQATANIAKVKSGHGSPGALRTSKAARKAARELKKLQKLGLA